MGKTKKTKIIPGVTNKQSGGRPQVKRPKADQPDSTKHIGFATSGITSSMSHGEPYVKPGVTGKDPAIHRRPTFVAGMLRGLRKFKRGKR